MSGCLGVGPRASRFRRNPRRSLGTCLRACYAMSGTRLAYDTLPTRLLRRVRYSRSYVLRRPATRCPVLT
eukprot:2286291-Rhodomonas_salina.3